jgi:hypothetical protein
LVYQQHATALLAELASKIGNATPLEVEIVHVDVQALTVVRTELLFRILKEESGLPYSTRTLDAYHAMTPVYLIHQDATNRGIDMLNQVTMRAKESFHS